VRYYRTLSLAEQAATLQSLQNGQGFQGPQNTIRWSELSISTLLPERIAHRLLASQSVMVTLAGRNLVLWTNSVDRDPNMNSSIATTGDANSGSTSRDGIPHPRDFVIRVKLGY